MNYGRRMSFQTLNTKQECPSECSDMAGSDQDMDERGTGDDSKRRTRNQSEKKRRDQFNILISELGSLVGSKNKKMDKTSVLRSTIQLLKQYNALQSPAHEIQEDWKPASLTNDEFTQLMLEAIGGFILIFSESGVILYVSESVSPLLGYANSELINQNLFDMLAPHERSSIRSWVLERQMYANQTSSAANTLPEFLRVENQIQFQCQLRCGRGIGGSSGRLETTYRMVEIRGCLRILSESARVLELSDLLVDNDKIMFCCIARIIGQPIVREIAFIPEVGVREFTTRHSMEWKYLFMDQRGPSIIGYLPFEVLGTSGFDYLHPDDLSNVARFLRQLRKTGEVTSCFYRFMTKGIQWIWLQSRAHINYNQWNSKPEFITSVNVLASEDQVRSAISFLDANDNDISESQCRDSSTHSYDGLGESGTHDDSSVYVNDECSDRDGQEESMQIISSTVRTPPDCAATGVSAAINSVGDATLDLQAAHVDLPCPANPAPLESNQASEQLPVALHLTTAQRQLFTQLRSKHAHIRAVMRRQQAQLDRVSRILSWAEKGQLSLDSPCSSPPPHSTSSPVSVPLPAVISSSSSVMTSVVTPAASATSHITQANPSGPPSQQQQQPPLQQQQLQQQQAQQQQQPQQQQQQQPQQQQQQQQQPPPPPLRQQQQKQEQQQQQQQMHNQQEQFQQHQQLQSQLEDIHQQQSRQEFRLPLTQPHHHQQPQQQQTQQQQSEQQHQDYSSQIPILQTFTDEVMPEVDTSMLAMMLPCWPSSMPP